MDGFKVQVASIDANHMDICKFADSDDVGYERTSGFIGEMVELADTSHDSRSTLTTIAR